MALSEWPERFDDRDSHTDYVLVEFEEPMFVAAETDRAIGLADDEGLPVDMWFPKSRVLSPPSKGDWIDELEMPKWLAEQKGLQYE